MEHQILSIHDGNRAAVSGMGHSSTVKTYDPGGNGRSRYGRFAALRKFAIFYIYTSVG